MAPRKQSDRGAREARDRLRAYQARQSVHEHGRVRRVRDNWISGVVAVLLVAAAVVLQVSYFQSGHTSSPKAKAAATATATPSASSAAGANKGDVPPASIADGRTWTGTMTINGIPLGISLDGKKAPQAVSSTISLIKKGFYNGLTCHRLTTGGFYVLQCGDPKGDGTGGPGYSYGPIENAPANNVYDAGVIAMARQSGNAYSQGSQFFIVYKTTTIPADSAGGYTVIGTVTSGLGQLNAKVTSKGVAGGGTDGKPEVPTTIQAVTIH